MTMPVDAPSAPTPQQLEPSGHAGDPTGETDRSWLAIGRRVAKRIKADHVLLFGAGVAFFGFLATVPALIALVSIYALVADTGDIQAWVDGVRGALPEEARDLIVQQLENIIAASSGTLTMGVVVGLAIALWSASSGVGHLIEAVNVAYRHPETRGFVARRGLALGFTVGTVLFGCLAIAVITGLPALLSALEVPSTLRWLISMLVWPLIGVAMAIGLAILYRFAPDREPDETWSWVTPGSIVAVVAWIVASLGFQIYAANFGSYNEVYGSLGAVVVLLLWMWISALVVLVGAEINSELEDLEDRTDPRTGPTSTRMTPA